MVLSQGCSKFTIRVGAIGFLNIIPLHLKPRDIFENVRFSSSGGLTEVYLMA